MGFPVANGVLQGDTSRPIRMVLLAFTAACVSGDNYDAGTSDCGDAYPLKNLTDPQRVDLDPGTDGVVDASQIATDYDPGLAMFAATVMTAFVGVTEATSRFSGVISDNFF